MNSFKNLQINLDDQIAIKIMENLNYTSGISEWIGIVLCAFKIYLDSYVL